MCSVYECEGTSIFNDRLDLEGEVDRDEGGVFSKLSPHASQNLACSMVSVGICMFKDL